MEIEIIIPTEVSKTEKGKYHRASFICGIFTKKKKKKRIQMNLFTKQK